MCKVCLSKHACPVCLGSGRVVDAITAQDALCDAETLRPVLRLGYRSLLNMRWRARIYGPTQSERATANLARVDAINAARAAFRAVPALREEF